MPATLLLDDELDTLLRAAAQKSGRTTSEIASSVLRAALAIPATLPSTTVFRIQPLHGVFAPGINPTKLNQLAYDLETSAFLEKHAGQP